MAAEHPDGLLPLGLTALAFAWPAWRRRHRGTMRRPYYGSMVGTVVLVLAFLV
jgi:hypothetical protein